MYRKNTTGQFFGVQLVLAATGAKATGLTPAARRCIDGTFADATGSFTEDGTTGGYKFAMSQADTNGNNISFFITATGAIPVCVNILTTVVDPTAAAFGITDIASIKTQTDKMAFTVTNQIDANVLDWKSATAPAMTGDAYAVVKSGGTGDAAAIKAQTDKFAFTVTNQVDANIQSVNDVTVNGNGSTVPWGP